MNPASSLRRLCFHQIFEAQADQRPEAVAAVLGGESISYGELEWRANRLAHPLRRAGVGPDAVVGLALPRSLELVTAMLAILKAGGAYLPLDLALPDERLAFLLADSGAPLLLTLEELAPRLARGGQRTLCLDACRAEVAGESAARPAGGAELDNLAYVIYTSGSTGHPKGVQVAHRGLANCAAAQRTTFAAGPASRVLQFASWGFDASAFEILMAFGAGAALHLVPEEARVPGPLLAGLLRRERITHATLSPSVLTALAALAPQEPAGELPDLIHLVSAGEACPQSVVDRWAAGGRRFWNAYGPTETTIWATVAESFPGVRPAIGGAIAAVTARVLDAGFAPVPEGAPGELYVGGAGVARGYLGLSALTAARFVPDAWSAEPGARLYATGDLVRRRPDGALDYLGRGDRQVKIRGQRIEPGEVEAALDALPGVAGSAVLALADPADPGADPGPGTKRLVAWVVPTAAPPADLRARLREGLRERLPEAMVPALFVLLDAWPLTPNGKVDRAALPLPDPATAAAPFIAPRTPVERALAGIWGELLGHAEVGAEDDLLELGAHSLLLARFTARLRADLGIELAPRELFAHPTVAALAARVERLQSGADASELPPLPPVVPVAQHEPPPLSFTQERVWFLEQLNPATRAYNAQAELRFTGPLDAAALAAALAEIVRRHEIFRTGFPAVDGRPVQEVHPPDPAVDLLPVVDLSALPEAARQTAAAGATTDFLGEAFDVTRPPLVRWALLRHAPGPRGREHSLLQVEHHFVHDGWSFGVLLGEMVALYRAFAAGLPSPLPEPAIQYADFALWQRDWMRGEVLARHLDFWRRRLADSPPLLDLPTDRPRPRTQSFRGAAPRVELPLPLYGDLRALARRSGATLYALMLAAFKVLLQRYSGQDDLVVGTGVANRRARELEGMIGMVVNTIVLRTSLAGDPAFRELVLRVRDTVAAARAWEDLPFDLLVRELAPARDLGRNPLFQVMFGFHDSPVPDLDLDGITGTVRELHNGSAKTDLNIIAVPRAEQRAGRAATGEEGLALLWEHSADLFDPPTIARMIGHYTTLLAGAVADPLQRLSELPLLSAAERRQLAAWSLGSGHDYPREAAVDELFAAVAAAAPEAVAVVMTVGDEDEILTYGELDRRANRLAHHLRAAGVGLETPVGLAVERSPALVVGMLGILKAGGCYVPLDPAYPAERLAFMAADARLTVLVTCGGAQPIATSPEGAAPIFVDLERDAAALAARSPEDPPAAGRPGAGHLAYVMYTSGSTGRPKGVAIPHRGIVRLVRGGAYARFAPDEVVLQIAAASFDAATVEIWGALLNGALLAILPGRTPSLAEIAAALAHHRVTTAALTAGLFHQMVDEDLAALRPLGQLLAGGDVVSPPHVRRTLAELPGCTVVHCYGPTESTTFTCCRPMRGVEAAADPLPIGRPIAGTRVHLLDRRLQPVPAGVPGELYTGGDGLARGYLGRPELTAEKFVPDPFSFEPGGRLYRTGDLARYQSGGEIEFLGRIDNQVKIRGFRVEPGEVEWVLAGCPGVREAVVVVRAEGGDKRLAAYVTPAGADDLDALAAAARAFLAARLPDYLVPTFLLALPVLPLTAHGKVDRAALPAPSGSAARAAVPYARPRGPLEERLAGIWADVLRVERVGIHDNFFDLGGHSLLATRLIARVRRAFEVDLPVHAVFEGGTVAGMAGLLAARRAGAPEPEVSPLITLQPEGDRPPLFFLHPVGGGVSSYAFLVRHLGRDQPSFGLQAPGLLDNRVPFDRLEPMATLYAAAIQERCPDGPYLLAGWSLGGWIAFEVARQLIAAGREVALVALLDTGMRLPDQPPGDPGEVDAAMLAELFNLEAEAPDGGAWSVETLVAEARRTGMVEEAFSVAQADRLLQVFRGNMIAQDTYAARPYPGRLTLLRCTPPEGEPADPTRGWGALAEGGVDVRRVPGTHATLVFEPHAGPVAATLRAAVDDALAARRPGEPAYASLLRS